MALTSIRADFRQTLDVHRHFTPKITFNFELSVNELTNADDLALCQVPNPSVGIHTGALQNPLASAESDVSPTATLLSLGRSTPAILATLVLLCACSRHGRQRHTRPLALALLVPWIVTNHAHHTTPLDHLALITTSLD